MNDKIKQFIGIAKYDAMGQYIWGVNKDGDHQKIADLRGWGAIQGLFRDSKGEIDNKGAEEFQDELGEWITSAINEKLKQTDKEL